MRSSFALCVALFFSSVVSAAQKPLQVYFIDVEGGQATLFVTPAGQSLLIDTGWPGNAYRDANRIAAAAKLAKVKKIDYVIITHYHEDHVGGVPQLVEKIPVGTFIDHGANTETGKSADRLWAGYQKGLAMAKRLTVKPGDTLPIKGLNATIVSSNGEVIARPVPGAGAANSFCGDVKEQPVDTTENARSVGTYFTFGKFRTVDLGDLTWNKETLLACPNNKLGQVDVLIVSHHGFNQSSNPVLVKALAPRVAIMDNGAKKGGSPSTWDVIKSSPGLEDLWQLHFSNEGGKEHNPPDSFIANVDEADTGYYLKLTAYEDGSFEVYNARNKQEKKYAAK
jgi:competence protein ComEC